MKQQQWVMIIVGVVVLGGIGLGLAQQRRGATPAAENQSQNTASLKQLLQEAAQSEQAGDQLKAQVAYGKIVSDYSDYDKIEDIQQQLGQVSIGIITSNMTTPQTQTYEVKIGDSLGKLAKQYNTTKELIKKSNHLKSDVIRVGQSLRIWTAPFSIFVDKSQNILILKSGDDVVKVYHVSTGKNNSTPVGVFKITNKMVNPVWFKSGGPAIPAESPANELGTRWMGFESPHSDYGIHGTIHPDLIGQQVTSGCVRLVKDDVEELFDLVPQGTLVTIQD